MNASSSPDTQLVVFDADDQNSGLRIDQFLAQHINGYSRVFLRKVVQDQGCRVDGEVVKPSFRVQPGQRIELDLPPPPDTGPLPESIPLNILFEDDYMIAVDKPPAMVVHPAKGHWNGTLTSALAYHFKQLSDVGGPTRPGIVHRLDRDTTGVIVVAKTNAVHLELAAQFESRDIEKEYTAIVVGVPDRDRDCVKLPIGNHPYQRDKMAIRSGHETSRDAETFFEVTERFQGYALLKVVPKTGRTHQIRVHLSHLGYSVLCDRLYAGHARINRGQLLRRQAKGLPPLPNDEDLILERQALHARRLKFRHPVSGETMVIEAPLHPDMLNTLDILRSQT